MGPLTQHIEAAPEVVTTALQRAMHQKNRLLGTCRPSTRATWSHNIEHVTRQAVARGSGTHCAAVHRWQRYSAPQRSKGVRHLLRDWKGYISCDCGVRTTLANMQQQAVALSRTHALDLLLKGGLLSFLLSGCKRRGLMRLMLYIYAARLQSSCAIPLHSCAVHLSVFRQFIAQLNQGNILWSDT